jgi:regulator of cell morphogenesis and NO signaling
MKNFNCQVQQRDNSMDAPGIKDSAGEPAIDVAAMSMTELVDHIEQTHHEYLRSELPRLDEMAEQVASVHGKTDSRLPLVRETYRMLVSELSSHMLKEEQILFPMVRDLDASETTPTFHCGSLANPIQQMNLEHTQARAVLGKLRELTDSYSAPEWACDTYRAMLDALARLERDMHQHIHKEDDVLFPRALGIENEKSAGA